MNKFFATSLLAICLCVFSCTSDERIYSPSTQEAYDELSKNLAVYNAEFQNTYDIPQTRGFFKRLKGFLFSDASGALIGSAFGSLGALVGAVFYSAICGPMLAEEEITYTENSDDDMSIAITDTAHVPPIAPPIVPCSSGSLLDSYNPDVLSEGWTIKVNSYNAVTSTGIGYQHNMVLSRIEEKNQDVYNKKCTSENMIKLIEEEMEQSIGEANKNILIQKMNSLIDNRRTKPTTELITTLKSCYPEYSYELLVLDDFINNIENMINNQNLLKTYLTGYLQIISNANLSDSQKEVLKSSLEVAANSAVLWRIEQQTSN